MVLVVMMIVTDGGGCDNDKCQMVLVVMMIVSDDCGCDGDSDRWW